MRILSFLLLGLVLLFIPEGEIYPSLASDLDSLLEANSFNGVIRISQGEQLLYSRTIGYADLENKVPLQPQDAFVIGSISKQITAVLVMQACEQGLLRLEDTIDQYLPEIAQDWASEISIHQLLSHTHGIQSEDAPLAFTSGSQFQYSQLGYSLLARILEKVQHGSFQQLATALFRTHGLMHSYHPDDSSQYRLVKGYEQQGTGSFLYQTNSLENYAAAGTFIATATDLDQWNYLLHQGNLVSSTSLALMKTRHATRMHPIFDSVAYGYGLLFKEGEAQLEIGTLGYVPGFVSASYYYPQTNMSVVILENTARQLPDFAKTFQLHLAVMDKVKRL